MAKGNTVRLWRRSLIVLMVMLREKGRGAKGIEGMKRGQIIRAVCAKVK